MTGFTFPLFTYCKFIINDKIPNKDGELFKLFTNIFNFKISSIDPLIIEKDWPSHEDLTKLVEALKSLIFPNSKNCDLEERPGGSCEQQGTNENVKSGDAVQMLPKQTNGYEQLTKHIQTTCEDAVNTDIQALGTNDDKHYLIKVYQGLKANYVSADQESVSANKVFDKNATASVHSRQKDVLQIKKCTPDEEKETPAGQGATTGPKGAEELIHKRSHAALLSFEAIYEKEGNPATRLLERDNHDMEGKSASRKIENNETVHKKVKSQKSKTDPTEPQPHKLTHRRNIMSFALTKNNSAYYARSERSKMKVHILKSDITRLDVDCIVNTTNRRLQHGGGVSKAISLAAGPSLNKECEAFINSGNQVAVTDIFLSTGGNLPAKCVMHAVGPHWDAYDDKSKPECFDDLRHTVIRCLVEAGRQGFTSIALPSISAAMFKVPEEVCARCYMEAVKHFATFNEEQISLHAIYFVDGDDSMVKILQEHFEKNWTNPCDPHIVQKDCDFAGSHVYSATRNIAKHIEKLPDTSLSTKTPGVNKPSSVPGSRLSAGSTASSTSDERRDESLAFQIGSFTLNTDSRPAFDLLSDITITVGKPFDKLSGIYNFSISDNKQKKEGLKNKYRLFNVSKPKGHHQKQLCALFPEPDCEETIKEALGNLDIILQNQNNKIFTQNIRKVVLTSSILYKEPDNVQNKKQYFYDRKKAGHFAKYLFEYLKHASGMSSISITLVGCEDSIQSVHKVMESRGVRKISCEAQQGARSKTTEGSHCHSEGDYSTQHSGYAVKGSDYSRQHRDEDVGSSVDLDKTTCPICACEKLCVLSKCCGKYMCQGCQEKLTICPYCRKFWRVLIGDQPPGTMSVRLIKDSVAGYESFPTWKMIYFFPPGYQKDCHPNPGECYTRMTRTAYLPATIEGFHVLKLLRLAFLRKLTFTIGRSLTIGCENSIVWNDIHHKTNLYGGMYGYPDPNYLHNVSGELASKGVTFDTASAEEMLKIKDFEYQISAYGHFTDVVPQ